MAHTDSPVRTTPKDFFLWLTAIVTTYGTITAFLTLIFAYINTAFPDPLSYGIDVYSFGIRGAMATLIVLVPIMLGILLTLRREIVRTPAKADLWVRRWALVLTIFIAGAVAVVDLIVLLTAFLNGDLSIRFALKAVVVLLVASWVCMHFLADYWGFWTLHRKKANAVGAAVGALAVLTIAGGFMLAGSPATQRAVRFDEERTQDLNNIQYQITYQWQNTGTLPESLEQLTDPLSGFAVPVDPETGAAYQYAKTGDTTFELCATFAQPSRESISENGYEGGDIFFNHGAGYTCFARTIDPAKYPVTDQS